MFFEPRKTRITRNPGRCWWFGEHEHDYGANFLLKPRKDTEHTEGKFFREGEVPSEPQVRFAAWQEPRPPDDAWSPDDAAGRNVVSGDALAAGCDSWVSVVVVYVF